jgi:hypothetical protein
VFEDRDEQANCRIDAVVKLPSLGFLDRPLQASNDSNLFRGTDLAKDSGYLRRDR